MRPSLFDVFADHEVDTGWVKATDIRLQGLAQRTVCGKDGNMSFIVTSVKAPLSFAPSVKAEVFSTMGQVMLTVFPIKDQSVEAIAAMMEKTDGRMDTRFITAEHDEPILSASSIDFQSPPVVFFFLWEQLPEENECCASAMMVAQSLAPTVLEYLDKRLGAPFWFDAAPSKHLH